MNVVKQKSRTVRMYRFWNKIGLWTTLSESPCWIQWCLFCASLKPSCKKQFYVCPLQWFKGVCCTPRHAIFAVSIYTQTSACNSNLLFSQCKRPVKFETPNNSKEMQEKLCADSHKPWTTVFGHLHSVSWNTMILKNMFWSWLKVWPHCILFKELTISRLWGMRGSLPGSIHPDWFHGMFVYRSQKSKNFFVCCRLPAPETFDTIPTTWKKGRIWQSKQSKLSFGSLSWF